MSQANVTITSTPKPQPKATPHGDCVGATPIDRMATDQYHVLCIRPTPLADGTTHVNYKGDPANMLATSSYSICESGALREAPMSILATWHNDTIVAKLNWCFDNYGTSVPAKLREYLVAQMPIALTIETPLSFAELLAENAALKAAAMPTLNAATK